MRGTTYGNAQEKKHMVFVEPMKEQREACSGGTGNLPRGAWDLKSRILVRNPNNK
jgi:hypothetical protein